MIQVKIQARPNETIHFPGLCVHCGQPGNVPLRIQKRNGRFTRLLEVPLCVECAQEARRKSGEEERLIRIAWAATGGAALLLFLAGLLLTPAGLDFGLRLAVGLVLGIGGGTAVFTLLRPLSQRHALPAKQAILAAAQISDFSWRTTTFLFTNETFAERFRDLNQPLLYEL
jgi:hypothetical protein